MLPMGPAKHAFRLAKHACFSTRSSLQEEELALQDQMGFTEYSAGPPRLGWLVNLNTVGLHATCSRAAKCLHGMIVLMNSTGGPASTITFVTSRVCRFRQWTRVLMLQSVQSWATSSPRWATCWEL